METYRQLKQRLILSRRAKVALLVGTISLFLAAILLAALLSPVYALSPDAGSLVQVALANQQDVERNILAAYTAGDFSISSPFVIQDPYHNAPLTALLIFDTPTAAQVSIHVPGKTPQAAVDFTFAEYTQHHEIPIYGLYPDTFNHVTVSLKMENGSVSQTEIKLQTEPLPVYMNPVQLDSLNRDLYSPGFNFTFIDHKVIFDIDGAVRWYTTDASFRVFTKLANGRYLYTYSVPNSSDQVVMEKDLLGKIYTIYNITDGVQHDIYELPDGNFLLTSQDSTSNTNQDMILEIDRTSGHIVRSIDLKKYLDPYRQPVPDGNDADWLHLNSIVYDPTDSSIIISSRSQSAVIKMSYPDMKLQWILGPHDNWSARFQPYLLRPVGEAFEWPWTEHDATLYAQDPPSSHAMDILLFDNGLYRSYKLSTALNAGDSYSRVVHYRVDQAKMTVEQVWEYGKERGSELFSVLLGSASVQANGNVIGDWAEIRKDVAGNAAMILPPNGTEQSRIIEVNPLTDAVASEYTIPTSITYRIFRAGLYDGYSEDNHFLSVPPNDTTSNDLQDRSVMLWRDVNKWLMPAESWVTLVFNDLISSLSSL
jgi:arylsulfate sulfotransferase